IGQTSDQSIAELAVNQRMIVSLPSDTEIYVVLQKETKPSMGLQQSEQVGSHANVEELRQLLQLQREMNQPSDGHVPD
ncbi:MAG TPA: hypothetical protein VM912_01205, partial [Terriglobales bacterium]|nr:hypothetical protein [Terriglobales bacterium]